MSSSAYSTQFAPIWLEDRPLINLVADVHQEPLELYLSRIESGEVLAGKRQLAAIDRFQRDLETGEYSYDAAAVDRCVSFFQQFLRHSTGAYAGEPFILRPWQVFIVANLVGFKNDRDRRRFRQAHICLGRGNGKSPFAAGLLLYLTFFDNENRASGYCAATKREQARIVFDECRRFIEQSEPLAMHLRSMTRSILSGDHSSIEPISSDKNYDGLIPHCVVLDEVHAWTHIHRDRYDKLQTGMGKRLQPLEISITTAGDDLSEIWLELRKYSDRALDPVNVGKHEHHFAFIADVDQELDVLAEENWVMANPMLQDPSSPVQVEYLETLAAKATEDQIARNQFARYHANQLVASTSHWMEPGQWELGAQWQEPEPGATAYGAFDLARTNDFSALAVVWPVDNGYIVESWAWTCKERSKSLKTAAFRRLLKEDHLIVCEGDQIDFELIREKIEELSAEYHVQTWAYDPAWARETAQLLQNAGFDVEPMSQSAKTYNEPLVRFRDLLGLESIFHANEQVLAWQAGNLMCKLDTAGLSQPYRRDTEHKIDGIVSVLMAFRLSLLSEGFVEERFYDNNDLEAEF